MIHIVKGFNIVNEAEVDVFLKLPCFLHDSTNVQQDPLEEEIAAHSSILAWEIHRQRRLGGYSPWGHRVLDMTERRNKSK